MSYVPDPLPDGTALADLQAAVQAAWLANGHATIVSLLQHYNLFDRMCPCCAQLQPVPFRSANAAHRDNVLVRLCETCRKARLTR